MQLKEQINSYPQPCKRFLISSPSLHTLHPSHVEGESNEQQGGYEEKER